MIVEFSLGNYRSFNEIQTLSFRATGLVSEDRTVDENNIVEVSGQRLLKTVGVYGANASGKSNLIKGLEFLKAVVKSSLSEEELLLYKVKPNRSAILNNATNWGYFQIILLIDNKKYRYGFTLDRYEIASEWLFGPAKNNETFYFIREKQDVRINQEYFSEGGEIPYKTKLRSNSLFLSFCSSYNGDISGKIRNFIANDIDDSQIENDFRATNSLVDNKKQDVVLTWLTEAGLNYNRVHVSELGQYKAIGSNKTTDRVVSVSKNVLVESDGTILEIEMDLILDESQGTQKYYALIGHLYKIFENGGLLVSDEIDSNFHPALLRKIIGMFNNPAINKANAQLLFTSHDTNLMSPEIMRRDQFYFTEKSPTDATLLYSLADLKGIRNNADFAKQYLAGYYGALPVLGNLLETQANPE